MKSAPIEDSVARLRMPHSDESASPWLNIDVYVFIEIIDYISFKDFLRLGSVLFSSKKLAKQWDSFRPKLNSRTLNNHVYSLKTLDMLLHNEIRVRHVKTVHKYPLIEASGEGRTQIVQLLLDDGVDVNMKGFDNTALALAIKVGHEDIVQLLLGVEGIDINEQNRRRDTALTLASGKGHEKLIQLLLGVEGIDLSIKNYRNKTALALASKMGHQKIVQLLQKFSREHSV